MYTMEKRYFVLKKGYVNIDKEYFYFSDHGNWKTCEILEETENPKLTLRYVLKHLFEVFATTIAIVVFMFLILEEFNFSYEILFVFAIFHFLNRRYKIAQFKIPIRKIEDVQVASNVLMVKFLNIEDQQIIHTAKLDDEAEVEDIKKYLKEYVNHKFSIA